MARQRTGEQNHVGILDRFRGRGAAVATALGLSGVFLAGCSSPTEAQPPTVATSSAKPDAQPSASPTSSSSETAAPTQTKTETGTKPDTEALVAALDKASPEAYVRLDSDARLTWVLTKGKEANDNGYFSKFLNQQTSTGTGLADFNPFFTPLNKGSNGQDIVYQHLYFEALGDAWQTDVNSVGNGPLDQKTAEKLISARVFDPKSAVYKDRIDTVRSSTVAGRLGDKTVFGYRCVSNEPGDDMTLEDGTKAPTRLIILSADGQTWEEKYVFVERTELGENNGLWLLVSEHKLK